MDTKVKPFNRTIEDVGNIVLLEHVNVTQRDQRLIKNPNRRTRHPRADLSDRRATFV